MGFQTVLDGHSYNLQAATIHRDFLKYHTPGKTRPRPQTIPGLDACKEVAGQHWSNGFPFETNLGKAEANFFARYPIGWMILVEKKMMPHNNKAKMVTAYLHNSQAKKKMAFRQNVSLRVFFLVLSEFVYE